MVNRKIQAWRQLKEIVGGNIQIPDGQRYQQITAQQISVLIEQARIQPQQFLKQRVIRQVVVRQPRIPKVRDILRKSLLETVSAVTTDTVPVGYQKLDIFQSDSQLSQSKIKQALFQSGVPFAIVDQKIYVSKPTNAQLQDFASVANKLFKGQNTKKFIGVTGPALPKKSDLSLYKNLSNEQKQKFNKLTKKRPKGKNQAQLTEQQAFELFAAKSFLRELRKK